MYSSFSSTRFYSFFFFQLLRSPSEVQYFSSKMKKKQSCWKEKFTVKCTYFRFDWQKWMCVVKLHAWLWKIVVIHIVEFSQLLVKEKWSQIWRKSEEEEDGNGASVWRWWCKKDGVENRNTIGDRQCKRRAKEWQCKKVMLTTLQIYISHDVPFLNQTTSVLQNFQQSL